MNKYKHLSLEEREKLVAFKEAGLSLRDIAKRLGRSPFKPWQGIRQKQDRAW